jgi:fatty acid-binding protein DegV
MPYTLDDVDNPSDAHNRIGVIIGTHVGPGGLAVSFWGERARQ